MSKVRQLNVLSKISIHFYTSYKQIFTMCQQIENFDLLAIGWLIRQAVRNRSSDHLCTSERGFANPKSKVPLWVRMGPKLKLIFV